MIQKVEQVLYRKQWLFYFQSVLQISPYVKRLEFIENLFEIGTRPYPIGVERFTIISASISAVEVEHAFPKHDFTYFNIPCLGKYCNLSGLW